MKHDSALRFSERSTAERHFPHVVEMPVPSRGFGNHLRLAMEAFHLLREIPRRFGRPTRRRETEYCRWCFARPTDAAAFRDQFGGEVLADRDWTIAAE
jgi:hypothetical protein